MDSCKAEYWEVIKGFNNNILLVKDDEGEKILLAKGIGFGKNFGERVEKTVKVDKVFAMENIQNKKNFKDLINHGNEKIIGMCEEVIYMIEQELGEELDEKIHISLTDHVSFAIRRIQNGEEIQNPFIVETETLYKQEIEIAQKVAHIIEDTMGIEIPYGECGFIALHIHSARNKGRLSNTVKFTYVTNSIIEFIEDELDIYVDRQSLDFARFSTHIRFAIERILNETTIKNELLKVIKKTYKESYKLAKKASRIIEDQLDVDVPDDELGYLAIHIERFKEAAKDEA